MTEKILIVMEASEERRAQMAMLLAEHFPDARVEAIDLAEGDIVEGRVGDLFTFSKMISPLLKWVTPIKLPGDHRPYPEHLKRPGWRFSR